MRREVAAGMIKAYMHLQQKYLSEGFQNALRTAISALEQPEIIRCEDCKHYTEPNIEYCELYGAMILWSKDDFCSRGERRTDECHHKM